MRQGYAVPFTIIHRHSPFVTSVPSATGGKIFSAMNGTPAVKKDQIPELFRNRFKSIHISTQYLPTRGQPPFFHPPSPGPRRPPPLFSLVAHVPRSAQLLRFRYRSPMCGSVSHRVIPLHTLRGFLHALYICTRRPSSLGYRSILSLQWYHIAYRAKVESHRGHGAS